MSLTAPDLTGRELRVDSPDVDGRLADQTGPANDDALVVTCTACGTRQHASGRALGYTCHTCGSSWRVLRCRGCRRASVVLEGGSTCPRCGHDHQARQPAPKPHLPAWLTEPTPLSVWLGSVKYLGGHAERDQPVTAAGLLLDRRGIHLRAFAELFSIPWDSVQGVDIEGPMDISERLTMTRLLALGASTWAMRVAYLTVHTTNGDAIFEVDGLGPPELHARLSRVLQGLQRSEQPPAPIALERSASVPREPSAAPEVSGSAAPSPVRPSPLAIDPERNDAPMEVLIVDALWKLAHLREVRLLDEVEVAAIRARLLARIPDLPASTTRTSPTIDAGPLLHV